MQSDVPQTTVPDGAPDGDEETVLDRLPPEVVAELLEREPALVNEIREGGREQIPESVVERLPPDMAARIPDSVIVGASENPGLAAILIIVGILCVMGAAWGAVKGFLKMAVLLAIVGAIAWFWYLS